MAVDCSSLGRETIVTSKYIDQYEENLKNMNKIMYRKIGKNIDTVDKKL